MDCPKKHIQHSSVCMRDVAFSRCFSPCSIKNDSIVKGGGVDFVGEDGNKKRSLYLVFADDLGIIFEEPVN